MVTAYGDFLKLKRQKATIYVRNLNVTRALLRYFNISVIAKRFSFDVIVILLHSLVKLVRSLTACSSAVFPSYISAAIRGE